MGRASRATRTRASTASAPPTSGPSTCRATCARRRGVGRSLYQALFRVLAAQGLRNAFAGIALPNAASVALHESVGFVELGRYRNVGFKLGAWRDSMWLQHALAELSAPPLAPVPLAGLAPEELQAALSPR